MEIRILTNKKYSVIELLTNSIGEALYHTHNTQGPHRVYIDHNQVSSEELLTYKEGTTYGISTQTGNIYKQLGKELYLYRPLDQGYSLVIQGDGSIQSLIKQYEGNQIWP